MLHGHPDGNIAGKKTQPFVSCSGGEGDLRAVVHLAQVGEGDGMKIVGEGLEAGGAGEIGEVPPLRIPDPPLQECGVRPVFQHFRAVIAFEDERIAALQALEHGGSHLPRIGAAAHFDIMGSYAEPAGLDGIMRGAKRLDAEITKAEGFPATARSCPQRFSGGATVVEVFGERPPRGNHGNIQSAGEHIDPADMVRVLMGDKDRLDTIGAAAGGFHTFQDFPGTQPRINKESTAIPFDVYAVSFAAAGEDANIHPLMVPPHSI
jgi:hypothetical protein